MVWIGSAPVSQFRSRTAWISRMAASPRLTIAIRENGTRLEDAGAVVTTRDSHRVTVTRESLGRMFRETGLPDRGPSPAAGIPRIPGIKYELVRTGSPRLRIRSVRT